MARKSDNFPLVVFGSGLGLWLLFHTVWSILLEDWLKHQLERLVGHTVADIIEKFGSVGFPALAAIGVVWFLYSYIKRQLKAEHAELVAGEPKATEAHMPAFDPSWARDCQLSAAVWCAYSGNWGGRQQIADYPSPEAKRFHAAVNQIRQIAFEGKLPIWATRPRSNLFEPVPPSFWRNHEIVDSYTIHSTAEDVFVAVTEQLNIGENLYARTNTWKDFMTSKMAVEKLWLKEDSS